MSEQEGSKDLGHASTWVKGSSRSPSPSSRRSLPPSLLRRFTEITFVGEGGMGTVYRAVDPLLGRTVALKLMKVGEPDVWRRFCSEARAQAQIVHDHVCRVYDAGEADGEPFISMQFIEGKPLSQLGDPLPLEQAVQVMQQVAGAVHHAHRLGLIHRDIKPSNILVEPLPDGTLKPYIMDFGLVREVAKHGETETGTVVGTPQYMSPEQAKGDVRKLDRRSDVFSLGATLYELIAGRPPFVADQPWRLMMMVSFGEAPLLGDVKKGVPEDLETIVMRCLERNPARRYDSARALADDLERYLMGEPISAKRPSVYRVLLKKARRHKLLATLLGALLVGALVLAGVWIRAQQVASEQARLAHELGEDVKGMELFLRAAYGLPLHDVERDRDVVRSRLAEIERRIADRGGTARGPGFHAMGQGYLALRDPERAHEYLKKALAEGYSSGELRYALGRALGELFRRAIEDTRRISNAEERRQKVAAIEKELRDPALEHLRAAVGVTVEVPAYAEGLIALYQGDNEAAVAKAREAFEHAPWLYEAKKLEGDALFAEGSKFRHDAAFDHDKMKRYFDPAAEAYKIAAEMGRSDPDVHRAECELWEKVGLAAWNKVHPSEAAFRTAEAACERAVRASSRDGRALVQQALVRCAHVYALVDDVSESTLGPAALALQTAEESLEARPQDVMARYAVGLALYLQARVFHGLGREATMAKAIAAYERVLELDPRFAWAVRELGDAHLFEAKKELASGRDGSPFLRSAIRRYEEALALDPQFALPAGGRLEALAAQIEADLQRGRGADEPLRALESAVSQFEKTNGSPWIVAFWKARARMFRGLEAFAKGGDPGDAVREALETIRAFAGESPDDYWLLEELARCHLLVTAYALRTGADPEPSLTQARSAAQKALKSSEATGSEIRLLLARIDLAAVHAAAKRGKTPEETYDAALASVRPLLSTPGVDAEAAQIGAEVHALRAMALAKRGRDPGADVDSGLGLADRALTRNPHNAGALLARGRLLLARARAARDPRQKVEAERRAQEAFDRALRDNPLLGRLHEGVSKEASVFLP